MGMCCLMGKTSDELFVDLNVVSFIVGSNSNHNSIQRSTCGEEGLSEPD